MTETVDEICLDLLEVMDRMSTKTRTEFINKNTKAVGLAVLVEQQNVTSLEGARLLMITAYYKACEALERDRVRVESN